MTRHKIAVMIEEEFIRRMGQESFDYITRLTEQKEYIDKIKGEKTWDNYRYLGMNKLNLKRCVGGDNC